MNNLIAEFQASFIAIVQSGGVIVLAALIAWQILKLWLPLKKQKKWIPTVNAIGGALLGIFIPHIFPDQGIIVCAIYGAACGVFASCIYDKLIDKE